MGQGMGIMHSDVMDTVFNSGDAWDSMPLNCVLKYPNFFITALLFSACPSVRCHSNSVNFNQISSKFHIWIASINLSFKFEYGFCPASDNQGGRQNGRHLSISAVVVTLTQSFFYRISSKFHI